MSCSPHTLPATAPVPRFGALARVYRWMEVFTFGPYLARCRKAFLHNLSDCRRALVLGDGDGRFSAALLTANPAIEVDAVDASPAMLDALLRRAGHNANRVHAHCADARAWQPGDSPYDLIATHFFLDCLTTTEVRSLAEKLRGVLSDSGVWVISEFAVPEGWYGRLLARPLIWLLYRAFGLLTGLSVRSLPDHTTALRAAGFILKCRRSLLFGILASEMWT